ncbi:leucine-rich repeat and IQ domain-containing protein 1 [Stegastes partitus]|uniref:Leucine-rich repeat and IQ domain-containing protein 1 n=1 Tax=Stegastes partitus TaxID=144197 RepID=A0A9Y4KDE7_9TELE|nr:PREDICTED: leucine-rich repeat and IQ domain-containing protein 1 [Stegastes partitus]
MKKQNEQLIYKTDNVVNKSDDDQLHHALTETQAFFTHSLPVPPSDEDEAGTDEYMDNEDDLELKISECEAEPETGHCEEMQENEQRRQREMDFQEELRKIMEAEKLHQMELEVMERRAQEKLDEELLLQQELLNNLQKQVDQERRKIEEEQKRKKREEEKRKMKEQEEKRKMEEEDIRKRLEERKRMEKEEKRKNLERKKEEEEGIEEEMRKMEEERKIKEIRLKEEEKRRLVEEEERKRGEEKLKERDKNKKQEEDKTMKRGDTKNMMKMTGRTLTEDEKGKKEIPCKDDQRKMEDEERKKREDEEERRKEGQRVTKELEMMMKQEEMEKNEMERESDEERQKSEVPKKVMDGQIRRREGGSRKIEIKLKGNEHKRNKKDEMRHSLENKDMARSEEEKKTKEEELTEGHNEEMRRQKEDEEYININKEIRSKQKMEGYKGCEADNRKREHKTETKNKERRQEEVKKYKEKDDMGTRNTQTDKTYNRKEAREGIEENIKTEERILKQERESTRSQNENTGSTGHSLPSQLGVSTALTFSSSAPLPRESTAGPNISVTAQQQDAEKNISQTSICKTTDQQDPAVRSCASSCSLPEHTEQKRLLWMKDCVSWSKLCLQTRRKPKGSAWSHRGLRRAPEASSLPPLCPHTLLQSTGWKSLQEVTMVTLEDLPGCSLSTLVHCNQLRSLTLRRCGLKSLEGISQLQELCYIDLEENDISFVDCKNMTSLRVLRLAHNKLTSIHGLSGADSLDFLDLSHNSITRIAGLESVRRLQRLSLDHNQLISTKGLKDVYTLLHLDCSHNHLANVEGLENNALLHTLDLRGNSLTEPPSLNNQVLLRALHLDDNSISSLQDLTACWLPLLQHLSVAQNRITQLPSMSDFLSLENLRLSFNCLSELRNICENLERCQFLQEVHLTGNPLQQESGWRSTLQRAVPGLRAIDSQQTDSFLPPPAVQQVSLASDSFLTFCQAQLQQTHDLQQCHSRELSNASSSLEAVKSICRHFTMTLKLAEDQRFAHECGDTTVPEEHWVGDQTLPEKILHMDGIIAEKLSECPKMKSTRPPAISRADSIRCGYWSLEDTPAAESHHDTFDSVTISPKTIQTVTKTTSASLEKAPVPNYQDSDLKNSTAAVVIQQWWRKYKGNINAPPFSEKGGDGGMPASGSSIINKSAVDNYAATVIQAFWRGFILRRRLASALAAVKCPGEGVDDNFEEVDVDEFVFDEDDHEASATVATEAVCRELTCSAVILGPCKQAKAKLPSCSPGPDLCKAPPPPDPSPVPGA